MENSEKDELIDEIHINGSHIKSYLSNKLNDLEWDDFVESTPGGSHEQISQWAQVKLLSGWKPIRVVLKDERQIVGGFQLLWSAKKYIGRIGYISRGPVFANENSHLLDYILKQLKLVVKRHRIKAVIVHPLTNIHDALRKKSFLPNILHNIIEATTQLNLTATEEELLKGMRTNRRRNIKKAMSCEANFREGTTSELKTFFNLMLETCNRQNVSPNPSKLEILQTMWELYYTKGYLKLFFLEFQNTIVSGGLAITFGAFFIMWKVGWSGQFANIRPNDAFEWFAIKWAKNNGYKWYDFFGIDRDSALKIVNKQPLSQQIKCSPTFFKMGFGGEIIDLPKAQLYVPNFILRNVYRLFCFKTILNSPANVLHSKVKRLITSK